MVRGLYGRRQEPPSPGTLDLVFEPMLGFGTGWAQPVASQLVSNEEPSMLVGGGRTSPSRRGVSRASLLALVLLGGCGAQRVPSSYTGSVEKNFNKACVAQGRSGGKDKVSDIKSLCTCSYREIKKTFRFSEFKKINSDLSEKPGPLPAKMVKIVDGCTARSRETGGTTTSSTPSSSTTAKPNGQTTTTTR